MSGSAVGIYGSRGDEILDEDSPVGTGFLADIARQWEKATAPAEAGRHPGGPHPHRDRPVPLGRRAEEAAARCSASGLGGRLARAAST